VSQQPCAATTQRGTACRSFVPPGREFCVMHDPSMAAAVATARIKGGTMAAKVRMLEGKRLKLDSPTAVVKFTSSVVQDCLAGTIEVEVARTTLYGLGILLKAQEQARNSDIEAALQEVRALTEQARRRA
jgi:hypothetical protein